MKRRTFCVLAALSLTVVATGFIGSARAADAAAAGTWVWSFTPPNGGDEIKITLKLKQEADKLTGTITGRDGTESAIKDGKVKDGEVTFKVERERNGNVFVQNYKGKVDGDTIKGNITMTFNGEERSRDWEAKRSK